MSTGKFCWFDLMSSDVPAASAFYTGLFGWEVRAHNADYQMIHDRAGRALGGMMTASGPQPTAWLAYVTVDDINVSVARIKELGGKVFMQHNAAGVGEFAIYADRQGAALAVIQLSRAFDPYPREKGEAHISWSELHTPDPADALAFHHGVFGWGSESWGPDYMLVGDEHAAGIMRGKEGEPAFWLIYVNVANADACAVKATELGGKVIVPPREMGEIGRFAVMADPSGAVFAVMQSRPRG